MTERRRPNETTQKPGVEHPLIDEELQARGCRDQRGRRGRVRRAAVSPLENPLIERMAELGVETDSAVSVALQRAHHIAFYMRRGRSPRRDGAQHRRARAVRR
jgi:hypothetical protein